MTDNRDQPDENTDKFLDPVSGHGTFIATPDLPARAAARRSRRAGARHHRRGQRRRPVVADRASCSRRDRRTILCLSLSCYTDDDEPPIGLAAAIALIQAAGTVVVASAGNDSTCRPAWPAALPDVISVAALGQHGPASFTNYGPWVRACAPGVDVVSRFYDDTEDQQPGPDDYERLGVVVRHLVRRADRRRGDRPGDHAHRHRPADAAERVVDDPRLFRLPNLGTVVNLH